MTTSRGPVTLQWPGHDQPSPPAPPCAPREDPALSVTAPTAADGHAHGHADAHADAHADGHPPTTDNLLVHGDNRAALAALASSLQGRVACVYLDPPYNTGQSFAHYDDDAEHGAWLARMRDLLVAVRPLLAQDGVVVAQTDRTEAAYLKVLLDEVFGRKAYVTTIAVRMSATSGFKIEHTDRTLVKNVEHIHIYARRLTLHEKAYEETLAYDDHYSLLLSPDRAAYSPLIHDTVVATLLRQLGLPPAARSLSSLYERSADFRAFVLTHAERICRTHTAPAPAVRALAAGTLLVDAAASAVQARTWAGTTYLLRRTRSGVDQLIPLSLKLRHVDQTGGPDRLALTNILGDWWDGFHLDMGNVDVEGGVAFKSSKKPERLLRRLLRLFTRPGDLVLDPFGGAGTTAAVAHKMRRRWVVVEAGDHCRTLAQPRLRRVVQGEDPTGVSAAEGWTGGGGFRFLAVAPLGSPPSSAPTTTELDC
jgi:adenine-specific DNA-methyltransferase